MLTSKQRAALRSAAGTENALFQLGKEGITETFAKSCDSALTARELIKLTVLKTAPLTARDACRELAERLCAEPVATIGNRIVLYRYSKDKTSHVLKG